MRAVTIPSAHDVPSFDYYCPICGVELAESNYQTFDAEYFCPACGTQQRASRVPARPR